jgi:hypothetical protein
MPSTEKKPYRTINWREALSSSGNFGYIGVWQYVRFPWDEKGKPSYVFAWYERLLRKCGHMERIKTSVIVPYAQWHDIKTGLFELMRAVESEVIEKVEPLKKEACCRNCREMKKDVERLEVI